MNSFYIWFIGWWIPLFGGGPSAYNSDFTEVRQSDEVRLFQPRAIAQHHKKWHKGYINPKQKPSFITPIRKPGKRWGWWRKQY